MGFSQFYIGLLQGLIEGKDLPFFTRQLAKKICKSVFITDAQHHVLASCDYVGGLSKDELIFPDIDEISVFDLIMVEDVHLNRTRWQSGSIYSEGLRLPLKSRDRVWGYCFVVSDQDLSKQENQYLLEAALIIILTLKNLSKWQEEQEQYQTEFIRDILYNNFDSQASIISRARIWGWELGGEWALVAAEVDTGKTRMAKELVPSESYNKRHPLAAILNGQLLMLVPLPGRSKSENKGFMDKFIKKLTNQLKFKGFTKIEIGVGTFAASIDYLYKAYQEAKIALELGGIFNLGYPCYFEDMGVLKFVFSQPALELQEFSQRVLGDLLIYDRENKTDLVYTLKIYFQARMQIPECAQILIVHENTFRNRLKKIEQVVGCDLRRIDHLINLYVASQITKIGQNI